MTCAAADLGNVTSLYHSQLAFSVLYVQNKFVLEVQLRKLIIVLNKSIHVSYFIFNENITSKYMYFRRQRRIYLMPTDSF